MNLLKIAVRIGYELAKKEHPELDDERDYGVIKQHVLLVKDCFVHLDNMGYKIVHNEETSWDLVKNGISETTQFVNAFMESIDDFVEREGQNKDILPKPPIINIHKKK